MSIRNTFFLLASVSIFAIGCKKSNSVSQPDLVLNDSTDTVSNVSIVNKYGTNLNVDIYMKVPGSFYLYNFYTHFEVPANDTIQLPTHMFSSFSYDDLADIKVDVYSNDYTVSDWPDLTTYAYSIEGPKLAHKKMDFYLSGVTSGNKRNVIFKNGHEETKWIAVNAFAGRYVDTSSRINGNSVWSTLSAADKYKQMTSSVQGPYKISSMTTGGTIVDSLFKTFYFSDLGSSIIFQLNDTADLGYNNDDYYFASHFSAATRKQNGSPDTAALTIGNRVYIMVKQ